jgi:hypothetical protein
LGLELDNCGRTTKHAYCRIYSLWVQYGSKNCAVIFPVESELEDLPIDGYELSLNPGAIVRLIKSMIEDFFVIINDYESVF